MAKRYGKTHCPRKGVLVNVDAQTPGNLPSTALVVGPSKTRPGHVTVQFRFNVGYNLFDVPCDRLSKVGIKYKFKPTLHRIPSPDAPVRLVAFRGAKRRRKRRR